MYFKLNIFNGLNKKIGSEYSQRDNQNQESEDLNTPFLLSLYADKEFMDFLGYCYLAVQYFSLLCFIMGLVLLEPGLMIVGGLFFAEASLASSCLGVVNQLARQINQIIQQPERPLEAMNDEDVVLEEGLLMGSP